MRKFMKKNKAELAGNIVGWMLALILEAVVLGVGLGAIAFVWMGVTELWNAIF